MFSIFIGVIIYFLKRRNFFVIRLNGRKLNTLEKMYLTIVSKKTWKYETLKRTYIKQYLNDPQ